ncbi:MAG: tetratricopeptide repeat protein [Deltaproteobacteria bacterium]|nr:tetratricopeptide repeat protein [Deltaproteobacteria bacterium]
MDELRQLLALGTSYYQKGDYETALPLLEQIITRTQVFADVYNMLGVIYHGLGQFSKAEKYFIKALEINPGYIEAALNAAVLFNNTGKYEEAKKSYTQALTANKHQAGELDLHVAGKIANMHCEIGDAYQAAGRPKDAIVEYYKALSLGPSFVDIRVKLAIALHQSGNTYSAIDELSRVINERPDYHPARIQLGLCLFTCGHESEALNTWNEVLAKDPNNATAAMYVKLVGGPQYT